MASDVLPRSPYDAPPQLGTPQKSPAAVERDLAKILSVFYAVLGVFYLIVAAGAVAILVAGVRSLSSNAEVSAAASAIFVLAGVLTFLILGGLGVLNLFASKWLTRRRNRNGIFVIAAINCLMVPHGLLLGAATFVILSRDGMRYEFDRALPPGGM